MAIPEWANPDISNLLPKIRGDGEGKACEFKESFPDGNKLAKSVAAFATVGGGLILIGVRNNGTVAGLNEAEVDRLYHRAQSIAESVEPPVAHRVSQCYDDGVILVVCIHKDQAEPVYYYEGRPYIRAGRSSRPATPDEVKARFAAHPSAEHKRKMEELKYQSRKKYQEQRATNRADHHETSEATRRAFIPKE